MLTRLRLHQIRCFGTVSVDLPSSGLTVFTGANAQGKTTLLEAVCVLLRLQSPRASVLGELIQSGQSAAAIEGDFSGNLLRVVLGDTRKMQVNNKPVGRSAEYLRESGLVVWFGNDDIHLVRGGADGRRRFLDFAASQLVPGYLEALRAYDRALRARNFLLKSPAPDSRQLQAYANLLVTHGSIVTSGRRFLLEKLAPHAMAAEQEISATRETLELTYEDGSPGGLATALAATASEEQRRRSTLAGPHRDDMSIQLHDRPAGPFASEGQQRTIALALKVAQARVLAAAKSHWPILLIDDIFGELDPDRRHRLLGALPADAQKLATTTSLAWLAPEHLPNVCVRRVQDGGIL